MKTITKNAMFSTLVEVDDDRLAQLKKAPEIIERAFQAATTYWHSKILPEHFKKSAESRYGYAARSRAYLKQQRGKPDLVASGGMQNDLRSRASFKVVSTGIELRMSARALNFAPSMSETNPDSYVKHGNSKTGRAKKYPNLKREIKAITDDEAEAVKTVFTKEVELAMASKQAGELNAER